MQQPPNNQPGQHQPPYLQHPSFYNQPTAAYQPPQLKPLPHQRLWRWYQAQKPFTKLGLGCASLIIILSMCVCSALAAGTHPNQQSTIPTPTATSTQEAILVATA